MGWLVLNHDGTDLLVHKLLGEVITIGRVPLNHVVIDNPTVSAQHAILARLGDSYRLKDLHSTNGTHVNGVSITDAELNDGDKIRFGSVVAVFCGRSHDPVIRVYDEAGNVIETHEHKGELKER